MLFLMTIFIVLQFMELDNSIQTMQPRYNEAPRGWYYRAMARQRHKTIGLMHEEKQSPSMCVLNFGKFFCRPLQNKNVKWPIKIQCFVENVSTPR